jgi:hypothetical protein
MKKLLAVATIAVVGYKVVKKIKERKDNNTVEEKVEVNEEITIDNDEENIQVEDVEIVEDYENNKLYKVLEFLLTPIVKAGVYIWVRHVLFKKKRDYNETLKRCNNKLKYEAYKYYCKNN